MRRCRRSKFPGGVTPLLHWQTPPTQNVEKNTEIHLVLNIQSHNDIKKTLGSSISAMSTCYSQKKVSFFWSKKSRDWRVTQRQTHNTWPASTDVSPSNASLLQFRSAPHQSCQTPPLGGLGTNGKKSMFQNSASSSCKRAPFPSRSLFLTCFSFWRKLREFLSDAVFHARTKTPSFENAAEEKARERRIWATILLTSVSSTLQNLDELTNVTISWRLFTLRVFMTPRQKNRFYKRELRRPLFSSFLSL